MGKRKQKKECRAHFTHLSEGGVVSVESIEKRLDSTSCIHAVAVEILSMWFVLKAGITTFMPKKFRWVRFKVKWFQQHSTKLHTRVFKPVKKIIRFEL